MGVVDETSTAVGVLLEKGLFLFGAGKVEEAVEVWRRVLSVSPGNESALDYLESAGYTNEDPNGRGSRDAAKPAPTLALVTAKPGQPEPAKQQNPPPPQPRKQKRKSRAPLIGVGVFALLAASAVLVWRTPAANQFVSEFVGRSEAPVATPQADYYRVELQTKPDNATIYLDGKVKAMGLFVGRFERDGTLHRMQIQAPGHETRRITFVDEAPPRLIELVPNPTPTTTSVGARPQKKPVSKGKRQPAAKPTLKPPAKKDFEIRKTDNIDPWATPKEE